jgi:hypothetical protein
MSIAARVGVLVWKFPSKAMPTRPVLWLSTWAPTVLRGRPR